MLYLVSIRMVPLVPRGPVGKVYGDVPVASKTHLPRPSLQLHHTTPRHALSHASAITAPTLTRPHSSLTKAKAHATVLATDGREAFHAWRNAPLQNLVSTRNTSTHSKREPPRPCQLDPTRPASPHHRLLNDIVHDLARRLWARLVCRLYGGARATTSRATTWL